VDDEDEVDEDDEDTHEGYYQSNEDEYENVPKPDRITYNTELPSCHNYLGHNFNEVNTSKQVHASNDELQIPILPLPGNSYYENETDTYVQLVPGQIMPIYFYAPNHIQVVRKRMREQNPTIGIVLSPKSLRDTTNVTEAATANATTIDDPKLGILAEILSVSYHNEDVEIVDFSSLIEGSGGIILKIKGRERFHINSIRKDLTGCYIANVRILPEYTLETNPLVKSAIAHTSFRYETYLRRATANPSVKCSESKAEWLNVENTHPAWLLRRYDCGYLIHLIKQELNETFSEQVASLDEMNRNNQEAANDDEDRRASTNNPVVFSSWLLTNFPFDNKMRINCLKMNCINERLNYMFELLRNFTNISCRVCSIQFCTKHDVFSISKQGFMSAFLNPSGIVHETLTVFKLKNFTLTNSRPSTQHSWFPGECFFISVED
jgi:cereblon